MARSSPQSLPSGLRRSTTAWCTWSFPTAQSTCAVSSPVTRPLRAASWLDRRGPVGPRVSARAITAAGESGHPGSPHFDDEAERYATGNLRTVYFWPDQLKEHTERVYHPGS